MCVFWNDQVINELRRQLAEKDAWISRIDATISRKDTTISRKNHELGDLRSKLVSIHVKWLLFFMLSEIIAIL
jgi:hypothetical protein